MKAIQLNREAETKLELVKKEIPSPTDAQCLIRVKTAALNRRDQWMREGLYPGLKDGVTLGSDGCGIVAKGPEGLVGKRVVINPNIGWGDNPTAQASDYTILGMPVNGTLAEYIVVPIDRIIEAPDHLNDLEAAALPLAGMTAYRACITKGEITKNSNVLITGIGGGVSQMALQIATAIGASVWVTSGSNDKVHRAMEVGAEGGFNYRTDNWFRAASGEGPYDVIIDSAGGESINHYIKLIRPGGRIVVYGSTLGKVPQLDTARLFWSQAQLIGSTMSNDQEFVEMIDFVTSNKLRPTIDQVFSMDQYEEAFDRFKAADHYGKIILTC